MKIGTMIKRSLPYFLVLAVVILAIILRFYKLEQIPTIVSHDEIYYVVQAKTIQLLSTDPAGTWSPFSLSPAHPLFAELPGVVFSLGNFIIPDNPILAQRFISSVLSIVLTLSLTLLTFQFTKNKKFSGAVLLIGLLNPWSFQMARMAFDAPLSLVFYFLGINCFFSKRKWTIAPSLPVLLLGFYQYQGLKLIFPFLILLMPFILVLKDRSAKISLPKFISTHKLQLILVLILLAFFGTHLLRLKNQQVQSRLTDTVFSKHNNEVKSSVALDRSHTLPSPISRYIINDQTARALMFSEKYLSSFNPNNLFYKLEQLRNPFAVQSHGLFYLIDIPLILYGALLLRKKYKTFLLFLLGIILVAPFPAAINTNDTWTLFRSSLLYPPMIILSAAGLYNLAARNKIIDKTVFAIIACIYILLSMRFFFIYFNQYPVTASENYYFAERVLSNYLYRQQQISNDPMSIHANEADFLYYELLAHNKLITKATLPQIFSSFETKQVYSLNSITMSTSCISAGDLLNGNIVIADASVQPCDGSNPDIKKRYIKSFRDAGTYFIIFNDRLCSNTALDTYPRISNKLLIVENLTNDDFCKTFISSNDI